MPAHKAVLCPVFTPLGSGAEAIQEGAGVDEADAQTCGPIRVLVRERQIVVRYPLGERAMTWTNHIQADPQVLGGKPVIKGTRLAVEFVLGLLADGWTREQLRTNYPQLTDEALRAAFAYAAESLHDQTLLTVRPGAA